MALSLSVKRIFVSICTNADLQRTCREWKIVHAACEVPLAASAGALRSWRGSGREAEVAAMPQLGMPTGRTVASLY